MATALRQDLLRLRKLKREAEAAGRRKRAADGAFKMLQERVIHRLQRDETDAMKTGGTLFSIVRKAKGTLQDRGRYLHWALDQDPAIHDFIEEWAPDVEDGDGAAIGAFRVALYRLLLEELSTTRLREVTELFNEQANLHLDDGVPLPPGMGLRDATYISQRSS